METNAPYELRFEDRTRYLYASVKGEKDTLEISIAFWKEILQEAIARGYSKLLVTEDFKDVVSTLEMYLLVDEISRFGVTHLQVAFVDKQASQYELNKFAETVAVNRGVHGRIFGSEEEAERWLLATP